LPLATISSEDLDAELAEDLDLLERTCQMSAGSGTGLECFAALVRTLSGVLKSSGEAGAGSSD